MVVEYKDTSSARLLLLKELSSANGNLCAAGDTDQSLYSWRGAEATQILPFEREYPGATVVVLDQNYHSTPNILDVAIAVIAQNTERRGKHLWSNKNRGQMVQAVVAAQPESETRFITTEIRKLLGAGRRLGD